jgi:hypothetical protein
MKTSLLFLFALSFGICHADTSADSVISGSKHIASANIGVGDHAFIIGGEYENSFDRTYGLGGQARLYSNLDGAGGNPGFFTIGGFVRPHFTRGPWDLAVAPGLALAFIASNGPVSSKTTLGPTLSILLMYQFTPKFAFGVEHFELYSWTDSTYRGQLTSDFTLKGRYYF